MNMIILSLGSFLVTLSSDTTCLMNQGRNDEHILDLRTFRLVMEGNHRPLML